MPDQKDRVEEVSHKIVIQVIDNYRSGLNSLDNVRSIASAVSQLLEEERRNMAENFTFRGYGPTELTQFIYEHQARTPSPLPERIKKLADQRDSQPICPKCGSVERECLVPIHPHPYTDHDYCHDPWHDTKRESGK